MYYWWIVFWIISGLVCVLCTPDGYILKVEPVCGTTVSTATEIKVIADFDVSAEVLCKDSPNARPESLTAANDVTYTAQVKPNGVSSECSFYQRNASNIYTIQLEVSYGEVIDGKKVQKQRMTYLITCTYDQKGINVPESSSKDIIESYVKPEEIQRNMGIWMNGTFQLHIVDVLDNPIVGDVPLGRKVRLRGTLTRIGPLGCASGWEFYQDRCYKHFSTIILDYPGAEAVCQGEDAIIANAKDNDTNNFLDSLRGNGRIWLGLKDNVTEGTWLWSDGTPVTWFKWDGGEPNNSGDEDCVEFYQTTYWNDIHCNDLARYVMCEKAAASGVANDIGDGVRAVSCTVSGSSEHFDILRGGCGSGVVFEQTEGFETSGHTVYSPYFKMFKLPKDTNLLITCNYTVCETNCDGDSCMDSRRKRSINVLAEDSSDGTAASLSDIDTVTGQLIVQTKGCLPSEETVIGNGGIISCRGKVQDHAKDASLVILLWVSVAVLFGQMLTAILMAVTEFKRRRSINKSPYVSYRIINSLKL